MSLRYKNKTIIDVEQQIEESVKSDIQNKLLPSVRLDKRLKKIDF